MMPGMVLFVPVVRVLAAVLAVRLQRAGGGGSSCRHAGSSCGL